ncbi:MAG: hypothetical protein JWQ81_948 [Amycolatopsis sp.]|uniref:hypothetical protein n=1 Tax=Amycolatopsis sp. TaxID=37632 RepID=UPI00262ADFD2|nr:hypothetical protein [Amycolatopsis sp.]MCU1680209.1 hypothetical protein [Amycolatopsis sp.]
MTAVITQLDQTADATTTCYSYTRIVQVGEHIVSVAIDRDACIDRSLAYVQLIDDQTRWKLLDDEPATTWWDTTPTPSTHVDAAAVLGPVANELLRRASTILAPAPTTPTLSPHVLDAVSALLATMYGDNGDRRITPDDIAWATTYGGRLHVIEHDEGSVTFTKAHREQCPFITSSGKQDCDDDCDFEHPADPQRRHGQ